MIKKYILTLIIFLAASFYSCTSLIKNDMTGAEEIVIDARHQNALSLDSLIKSVEFIKLETTEDNFIGDVSQLLFTDSLLIVVDNRYANAIYVFDMTGKSKCTVGRRGNGPGEYVEISNVCLNPQKNRIVVLDRMQQRIIYYSLTGIHEYSERLPFLINYFEYLANGNKAYYVSAYIKDPAYKEFKENALIVTDSVNNIIYGDCTEFFKEGIFTFLINRSLRKFDDEICFSPSYSNIVYQVTDSMVIPRYHINIVWNGIPPLDDQMTDEKHDEYRKRYYIFNGDIIELKDFTYINILTPSGNPFVVYSHAKKQTFFSTDQGKHPLFPFLKDMPPKARYGENTVVFDVPAFHLMMNKEEWYKYEPDKKWLDDLYGGLTEDSNPVLVFCQLNEKIGYEE